MFARLHERLGRENGRYAANRTVALLRTMFNLAWDWGYLKGDNPAARVKFYREEKRDRFLSPEEVRRVNEALASEPNELLTAKWEDIDFEQKILRIPSTKAGRPHLLPLPNAAVTSLDSLPRTA
jgi:integrase